MKPITNILLVLALICYVFLAFYNVSLHDNVTGLEYTAGVISQSFSFRNVMFALVPFITCFAAIAFNCLKNRWWALASMVCIAVCIGFYVETGNIVDVPLQHAPDLAPDNDMGEGYKITGLGVGHLLAFVLTLLSLASAAISLLPFKFNQTLEQAVDNTFEGGKRHVREEWNRLESRHRSARHDVKEPPATQPDATAPSPEASRDREDNTRFMPADQRPTSAAGTTTEGGTPPPLSASDREDHARFMPPGE